MGYCDKLKSCARSVAMVVESSVSDLVLKSRSGEAVG
jgi:hypothetical protein